MIRLIKNPYSFFFILLVGYFTYIVLYNNYNKKWHTNEVNRHAEVIKEDIWATDYSGPTGYLTLAAERDHYVKIELADAFNEILTTIDGSDLRGIDQILDSLKLFPQTIISSDIKYDEQLIGKLIVHHRSMVIYNHSLMLLLFFLIYVSVTQFFRIMQVKKELEVRVKERTKELNDTNEQLLYNIAILNKAQEISHVGHFEYDIVNQTLKWSDEVYRIFEQDPNTFIPTYDQYLKKLHPEDRDNAERQYQSSVKNKENFDFEARVILNDTNVKYIQNIGQTDYNHSGEPIRSIGMIVDLTDSKKAADKLLQSKKKYQTLFNTSPIGLALCRANGDLVDVNPAYAKIIGHSVEETLKLSYWDITPKAYEEQEKVQLESLERIKRYGPYEKEYIHKEGHLVPVRLIGQQIEQRGEKLIWSSVENITEQRKLEQRLRNSQKMESIGNLAGGIAHDFNNLLYPIIGMSEMLLEDLPQDSLEHENAQEIFNAGRRAGDLVKRILAFSRQSEHKMTPTRIQNVLKEVLKLSGSTIPANIKIHEDIQQNCGLVMADPTQVHQIAMNLITNAFHAVEEYNGTIDIQLQEIDLQGNEIPASALEAGKYVRLSVSDNGIGMPQNTIHNIFEPYFTTKEQGKGTGLGLAVVYGIVKDHKGEIKVYSEVGKGTTFNVYLPLMKKKSETTTIDNVSRVETGTERILLVDDEISVANLEGQMLSRLGYQLTVETNSEDALNTFRSNPDSFDLVISDMTMPNMTGDQLAKEILSIKPDTPIIICTGFSERINKEQAEVIGVKGFLMKPVIKLDLAQMVRKVLDEAIENEK